MDEKPPKDKKKKNASDHAFGTTVAYKFRFLYFF